MSKIRFSILNKKNRTDKIQLRKKRMEKNKNKKHLNFLEFTNNIEGIYFSKKERMNIAQSNKTLEDLEIEIKKILLKYKER